MLEQQQAAVGAGLMGSDHTYKVPGAGDEPPLPPPPGARKCAPPSRTQPRLTPPRMPGWFVLCLQGGL